MRRWIVLLISLGTICRPATARADDVTLLQALPQCLRYTLPDKSEICGYKKIEDVRLLYALDAELVLLRKTTLLDGQRIEILSGQVINLQGAVGAQARAVDTLQTANKDLTAQLLERDRLYQDERVKPKRTFWWSAGLVVGGFLVGYVVVDLVKW